MLEERPYINIYIFKSICIFQNVTSMVSSIIDSLGIRVLQNFSNQFCFLFSFYNLRETYLYLKAKVITIFENVLHKSVPKNIL